MKDLLRATYRAVHFTWHTLSWILQSYNLRRRYNDNWYETDQGKQAVQAWMKKLCRILGLQVNASYRSTTAPVMLVANHVSWLDIVAISSLLPIRFVAKHEVGQWPIIGRLAKNNGTLFIRRDNRKSACETNQKISRVLSENQRIMIFPEGTTTDGQSVQAFKPALFEAARLAQCEIQPVAIRYWNDNELDTIAPYINDDYFIGHLWRIMCRRQTQVDLHFCLPIQSNTSRQNLATFCRMIISHELINNYPSSFRPKPATVSELAHVA